MDYSKKNSFPIFIFDNKVYFEDIIAEVMDKITFSKNHEILESKVDILLKENLNKATVKELALEINNSFKESFFALYFKSKKYNHSDSIITLLDTLKAGKKIDFQSIALKYKNGVLIIFTEDKLQEKKL